MVCAAIAAGISTLAASAASAQSASVVGRWSAEPACKADDIITIGPKTLKSSDVDCRFSSVSRSGNTVTWQGVCDDAEGSNTQTVIATLKGDVLSFRYVPGGNYVENLRRCR
jgi:hypothetical protein